MTIRRGVALLLVALALAGCGGAERGSAGAARLWITRDRGATLMLDTRVPAGESLLRALRAKARVDTRYGGRFVEAIDGVHGDASSQHDWFWFVNGLAGATGAAEYRLHAGDVAWWDYRDWSKDPELAVVVGAFPEPFLHGFDGRRRGVAVLYEPTLRKSAQTVARALHTRVVLPAGSRVPYGADVFVLAGGPPRFVATEHSPGAGPSSPVRFTFAGDVRRLLAGGFRRRFSVP